MHNKADAQVFQCIAYVACRSCSSKVLVSFSRAISASESLLLSSVLPSFDNAIDALTMSTTSITIPTPPACETGKKLHERFAYVYNSRMLKLRDTKEKRRNAKRVHSWSQTTRPMRTQKNLEIIFSNKNPNKTKNGHPMFNQRYSN